MATVAVKKDTCLVNAQKRRSNATSATDTVTFQETAKTKRKVEAEVTAKKESSDVMNVTKLDIWLETVRTKKKVEVEEEAEEETSDEKILDVTNAMKWAIWPEIVKIKKEEEEVDMASDEKKSDVMNATKQDTLLVIVIARVKEAAEAMVEVGNLVLVVMNAMKLVTFLETVKTKDLETIINFNDGF